MYLNTMLMEQQQDTYELETTTTELVHLWCGTCGVPTGSTGDKCYYLPQFVSRFKKLSLNDYDEQLTDYATETGYVIAPSDELDQTPVWNFEPTQNQPHDDILTWNAGAPDAEGNPRGTANRLWQGSSSIADRFHPELMMELKTDLYTAEAMLANPKMKICKKCGYQQHIKTKVCWYC